VSFAITATVRADGHTQQYGPYATREQAEKKAAALRREAEINAPFLSAETNATFQVQMQETAE